MAAQGLSILEALENLSAIVDASSFEEIEVTEEDRLILHKIHGDGRESDYWMGAGLNDQTLEVIRKTFQVVRDHLKTFYRKMKVEGDQPRMLEGINAVMVLVGEATKKLERYSTLFKRQITKMPEFSDLQEFYRTKVIKETFRHLASPTSEAINFIRPKTEELEEEREGTHLLNDLNVIKEDRLYELFYLKNEVGYDFFTPSLARNIKLACDFGEFADTYYGDDPLLLIKNWQDRSRQLMAQQILKQIKKPLEKYLAEAIRYRDFPIVSLVNKTIMALMIAANPRNLIRQFSVKGCGLYFCDFNLFLREVLHHREYQKLQVYAPPSSQPVFGLLMDLVSSVVQALFQVKPYRDEIEGFLEPHISTSKKEPFSTRLLHTYASLHEALRHHPSGPVLKALDLVRDGVDVHYFDPFLLDNLPETEGVLKGKQREVELIRLPSPTTQHQINQAEVAEEFRSYLRGMEGHLLFINYQDRTSWKEHARAAALEQLSRQAEFATKLTVITLPVETDFYRQEGVYAHLEEADVFLRHTIEHLQDETTGFFCPTHLQKPLLLQFAPQLIAHLHKVYFGMEKTLSKEERQTFLSLIYGCLILKGIELTTATQLAVSSKDGLDITATEMVLLLHLLSDLKEGGMALKVMAMLFGPTLVARERLIHKDRFDRLVAAAKKIEAHPLSHLAPLFDLQTVSFQLEIP